jgi:hypothetical protein
MGMKWHHVEILTQTHTAYSQSISSMTYSKFWAQWYCQNEILGPSKSNIHMALFIETNDITVTTGEKQVNLQKLCG